MRFNRPQDAHIITDRLTLRPRTIEDLPDCMAMDRDPEVTKYIAGPWNDPKAHQSFLERRMAQSHPYPFGYWTITRTEHPNGFLGWVMLLPTNETLSEAEIGWRLARAAWGQGIATEAVRSIVDLAYRRHPNLSITADIHPENLGSIRVAEKIGLIFDDETVIHGAREKSYKMARTNCL